MFTDLSWALTDTLDAALDAEGVPVTWLRRDLRAPNILSVGFPEGMPDGLPERLAGRGVYAAARLGRLRISPHVYNDEEDCAQCAKALRDLLR